MLSKAKWFGVRKLQVRYMPHKPIRLCRWNSGEVQKCCTIHQISLSSLRVEGGSGYETMSSTSLVPRLSPHMRERGSGVLSKFLVKWGGVAPQAESSNQIAEHVIICDDVNRAWDLALQTEGKLLSQLCSWP